MNRTVLGFCLICLGAVMLLGILLIAAWTGTQDWRLLREPLISGFYMAWVHTIVGYCLLIMGFVQKWLDRKNKNNEQ